ncbi:kinase-like protein [Dacryopinax primogenitus]|uniref:non-specific serine/threonine protein kinase n=1 Tax=Dacryopinax primogenitus (strain DJM 731) TaxID=1858805 RepID=M5G3M1_DACPD|nr:kinase-like protein [Dacryopinax primogenitus]EJU00457.1 kinase-like protein [Dacryopinax primogenitus]
MSRTDCEDLQLTADQSSGYFPALPGGLLNRGRYKVLRKLGHGSMSTTWLAEDKKRNADSPRYVAIKICTVSATHNSEESPILVQIRGLQDERDRLPLLWDNFEEQGPHGKHQCLVLDVLGLDLTAFRLSAPEKRLPVHIVKLFVVQIVEALVCLDSLGIIHSDLHGRNVLFATPILDTTDIETQNGSIDEVNIGGPFRVGEARDQDVSPYALRAPEILLKAGLSTKVDIWMLGCMTFELLTGHWLFNPKLESTGEPDEEEHLAQMLEYTGTDFGSLLDNSAARDKFFDAEGRFLHISEFRPDPIKVILVRYKLSKKEAVQAAAFIAKCLQLDPTERASARELQMHDWLKSAYGG